MSQRDKRERFGTLFFWSAFDFLFLVVHVSTPAVRANDERCERARFFSNNNNPIAFASRVLCLEDLASSSATLTYCFFFSFSLRVGIVGLLLLLLLFSGMMDTVGGVVRSTRPEMGDYRAISRRPDRPAVHGSMAATRRPERGARELDAGRGREVDEGARDAGSEVGGYRERD